MDQGTNEKLLEQLNQLYSEHYHDQIETLAENYPEQRSIYFDINQISQFNSDLVDDCISAPEAILE